LICPFLNKLGSNKTTMRKTIGLLSLLCIGLANNSIAQAKQEWNSIFAKINKEVLAHSNAYTSLKIASETIGHRLTGSENGKKAEEFTYNLLKSYGFSNVRYQPFEVESWSRGTLNVQIGSSLDKLKTFKSVSLAHSPVASDVSLELVDMGNGVEDD
jgi:hypothetical protein